MKSSLKPILKYGLPVGAVFLALVGAVILLYGWFVPKRYESLVTAYASEYGLESELIYAVIRTESNFQAGAVSNAGAVGLMQLMPSTARFAESCLGESLDPETPEDNLRLGCWYLRYLLDRFETSSLALAAYNAGEGTVRKWLREGEIRPGDTSFPYRETEHYVARVKKFYKCYKFFYF